MIYIFSGPFQPDIHLKYTTEPLGLTSVVIKWVNPYRECFSFRVSVDNRTVHETTETSFTVSDLDSSVAQMVCVEAMDGHGIIRSMDCKRGVLMDMIVTCTLEPPGISSSQILQIVFRLYFIVKFSFMSSISIASKKCQFVANMHLWYIEDCTTDMRTDTSTVTNMNAINDTYECRTGRATGVVKLHTGHSMGHDRSANCLCILG